MALRETTRWQTFRQQHRHRPLPFIMVLQLFGLLVLLLVYSYSFFQFQPERSYHHVVIWNAVMENKTMQVRAETRQARREARKRLKPRDRPVDMEYVDGSIIVGTSNDHQWPQQRKVKKAATNATKSHSKQRNNRATGKKELPILEAFLRVFLSLAAFTFITILLRMYLQLTLYPQIRRRQASSAQGINSNGRFLAWVAQLNRQRQEQGQQPLNAEQLRFLVMRGGFANDLDPEEEAAAVSTRGATPEEIDQYPLRIIAGSSDDLLQRRSETATDNVRERCAICLETYQLQDAVRTIPCFHSFHKDCIDPWISRKAVCPVCKHPAVA